ncbi:MAG: Panacea domain-containing protein [Chloroflexi bacterium]|nr:Panacea domain-containing protein [Chloroflexota bacterium]
MMVGQKQAFDTKKAVAIVLYLAIRTPRPSFMSIAKLMYFADKTHLERCGRMISTDCYVAMQHGPVPSHTYNLMRDTQPYSPYGFRVVDSYLIEAIVPPDLRLLAGQEVECLNEIIARFGDAPTWYLRQLSHDSAWQHAWQQAQERGKGSHPISEEAILDMIFAEQDWPDFIHEFRESL